MNNKNSTMSAFFSLSFFFIFLMSFLVYIIFWKKTLLIDIEIFTLNSSLVSFSLVFDWLSLTFSVIVCFISSCVMLFSKSYMSEDKYLSRFTWIVMLFVLSMNFFIFIPNLISLLLGWDGLGLVSFCLVVYYQNSKSLGAGLMTAFMNRLGDVAILLSIAWTFSQGHWVANIMWSNFYQNFSIMLLLMAGMTKSAQIPFSSWLPAAMAAPTPVSALVHSSTLVTAGVFLLIRFFCFLNKSYLFSVSILLISVMTMLMAGLAANFETDLKKIIALSTLSQLGVMMFSISVFLPFLSLLHLFTHALFKALLFLCAGSIIHFHNNNQDIRKMGYLWKNLPITSVCFNIANLALCGIPFFAGFYSKDTILEMMILNQTNLFVEILVILATIMTVSYSLRLSAMIFWGEKKSITFISLYDEDIYVVLPIMMLTTGATFGGACLMWIYFSPFMPLIFSIFDKMMILFFVISSAAVSLVFFDSINYKKKMPLVDFFSYMWFLSLMSNNLVSKPFMNISLLMFKSSDLGWLEVVSGEGVFSIMKKLTNLNQKNQGNIYNYLILVSTFSGVAFPVFLYF